MLLLLCHGALFGIPFQIPPKPALRALCARSPSQQSRGGEGLQQPSQSPASELAAAFPACALEPWNQGNVT